MKRKTDTSDRPGDMNKIYKNIKTGQLEKITKYEDKYKTLIMTFENGLGMSMTYGTFKREWEVQE